jgi:ketosteroid isomerase-like protein
MEDDGVSSTLTTPFEATCSSAAGARTGCDPRESDTLANDGGGEAAGGGASSPAFTDGPLSNEGIVARLFEAFSRRDLAGTLALMHPEIAFHPMTAEVTQRGEPYRGHDGIRRYMKDIEAYWDELNVHPAQIRAAGRAVVALGLVSGSGPAGSFENAPTTWVIKFKDGLVVHAQIFSDARYVVGALVGEDA